ncbi:peptidase [Mycena amicta]|nr:peptidase [Mycena amicta]
MFSRILATVVLAACVASYKEQIPLQNSSTSTNLRLVQLSDGRAATWMTEHEKLQVKAAGWDFMDITDTPPNSTIVADVLPLLSTAEPRANLKHLTSYHTRYYTSDTGAAASNWLYSKILAYTEELASEEQKALITIESVKHAWKQNSIVIRIAPLDALATDPTIVLGAHIDSINHENVTFRAPGAGLLLAGYVPLSPVEFHFYAGEEGGLRGSRALAARFEEAGKEVRGMIQFDMTAFVKAGTREEIAVIGNENQVDAELTEFLVLVIDRYIEIPWVRDFYPKGPSSDHQSWKEAGYQSCHPLESQFKNANSHIHGTEDLLDITPEFSFDHMLQYRCLDPDAVVILNSS